MGTPTQAAYHSTIKGITIKGKRLFESPSFKNSEAHQEAMAPSKIQLEEIMEEEEGQAYYDPNTGHFVQKQAFGGPHFGGNLEHEDEEMFYTPSTDQ